MDSKKRIVLMREQFSSIIFLLFHLRELLLASLTVATRTNQTGYYLPACTKKHSNTPKTNQRCVEVTSSLLTATMKRGRKMQKEQIRFDGIYYPYLWCPLILTGSASILIVISTNPCSENTLSKDYRSEGFNN